MKGISAPAPHPICLDRPLGEPSILLYFRHLPRDNIREQVDFPNI